MDAMKSITAEFEEFWMVYNQEHPDKAYTPPSDFVLNDPLYSRYYLTADGVVEFRNLEKWGSSAYGDIKNTMNSTYYLWNRNNSKNDVLSKT